MLVYINSIVATQAEWKQSAQTPAALGDLAHRPLRDSLKVLSGELQDEVSDAI